MECIYCKKEIKVNNKEYHNGCQKINNFREEIINLYVNEFKSIKEIRKIYKMQSEDIKIILGDKTRSSIEAFELVHKLYPKKYKHTDETKSKLRKIRLEYIKNNPEKTAWRVKNISYPEKLFLNKIEYIGMDKSFLIIREYSVFPFFIDFAFINEKVAVEIDGSQHLLPERRLKDIEKENLLKSLGWKVIRVTENEIKTNLNNFFKILLTKLKENSNDGITETYGIFKNRIKPKNLKRNEAGRTEAEISAYYKQRKIKDRPSKEILLIDVKELGYIGTGKKYNVSNTTIRKWLGADAPKCFTRIGKPKCLDCNTEIYYGRKRCNDCHKKKIKIF